MLEETLAEKLSLLLDGELDKEESLKLLDLIETDAEAGKRWRRYCLIREALRSTGGLLPDGRFVERVGVALADEPTILAPPKHKIRIREKAVTAALAASLAMVAVLVGKSLTDYVPPGSSNLLAQVQLGPNSTELVPVDPDFQDYLVLHNETAYLAGAQGMLPYVRLVSSQPAR
jgi:sigma-E factor negative regulatory protein RseA